MEWKEERAPFYETEAWPESGLFGLPVPIRIKASRMIKMIMNELMTASSTGASLIIVSSYRLALFDFR